MQRLQPRLRDIRINLRRRKIGVPEAASCTTRRSAPWFSKCVANTNDPRYAAITACGCQPCAQNLQVAPRMPGASLAPPRTVTNNVAGLVAQDLRARSRRVTVHQETASSPSGTNRSLVPPADHALPLAPDSPARCASSRFETRRPVAYRVSLWHDRAGRACCLS